MRTDLVGRVERISLTPPKVFYPLFEAVSNSLHAIQATGRPDGRITIELSREQIQGRLDEVERAEPIAAIRIIDNGVGFTDQNMTAFEELDTRHKLNLGGKGVGRLTWLKVFERIEIKSVYMSSGVARQRTFTFTLPEGVIEQDDVEAPSESPSTTVFLQNSREQYRDALKARAATIGAALVRHFLFQLLRPDAPQVTIQDGDTVVPVRADNVAARSTTSFDLKGSRFTVDHLKLRSPEKRQHLFHLCANDRSVKDERLKRLPDRPFQDSNGLYYYQAYVTAPYLDSRVTEQRTAFDMHEEGELSEVSFSDLRTKVSEAAETHLVRELEELAGVRDERVARVLSERLPDLQYVRQQNRAEIAAIPLGATDTEIEEEVGNIHLRNQKTGRALLAGLVSDLKEATTLDLHAFEEEFSDRIEKATRPSQANLAGYLLYRRAIVDVYREILKKSTSGFQREAAVHKLMFPMAADVDTARSYTNHNLWLLDERLTYAQYIASDQKLRDHRILFGVESGSEPDIICYFNLGFSEEDPTREELRSVVIVELKRPGPLQPRPENPWQQVMRYMDRLREGMWAEGGQKIKASESTRFYCFIVCDTDDPKIQAMVREYEFSPVFDGADGYTYYHKGLRAHVELIPFEKILRDSERKHRAFFERLGLL